MAHRLGIKFEGDLYHLMARENRQEFIFLDNEDWRMFFATLEEALEMTGADENLSPIPFAQDDNRLKTLKLRLNNKEVGACERIERGTFIPQGKLSIPFSPLRGNGNGGNGVRLR